MSEPPVFSPRYRAGWVDGVRYALERLEAGAEPWEIERAAKAISEVAEKRAKQAHRARTAKGRYE